MRIRLGDIRLYDQASERLEPSEIGDALGWHERGETHLSPLGEPRGAKAVEGPDWVRSCFRTGNGMKYYVTTFTKWPGRHTIITSQPRE